MENLILLGLGVLCSGIGIVNLSGNISTIHSYNRRKVKEEDIPSYGRWMGTGSLVMGLSLVASFFIVTFWREEYMVWVIVPAFAAGLACMLYAQFRYNGGIF